MKTVLLPVHSKWCQLILNGEKTVEVRKTKPREAVPFRVLLYCAKAKPYLVYGDRFNGQSFISEYATLQGYSRESAEKIWDIMNGKVIGEFVCDHIQKYFYHSDILYGIDNPNEYGKEIREKSCLTLWDFMDYLNGKDGYGWHISDLKIYDKPKELSEFRKPCENDLYCEECAMFRNFEDKCGNSALQIKRPPQSWCYVEGLR